MDKRLLVGIMFVFFVGIILLTIDNKVVVQEVEEDIDKLSYQISSTSEDGLIAYFPFENDTINYVNNEVATAVNFDGDELIDGKLGKAWDFDGVNDYIDVGDRYDFAGNVPFSVSFWVKVDQNIIFNWNRILSKEITDVNGRQGWAFVIQKTAKTMSFEMWKDGAALTVLTLYTIDDWQWHHVVGVYNTTHISIYFDTIKQTTQGSMSIIDHAGQLVIGRYPSGGAYFQGIIDAIRIYNRALSDQEVIDLYNLEKADHIEQLFIASKDGYIASKYYTTNINNATLMWFKDKSGINHVCSLNSGLNGNSCADLAKTYFNEGDTVNLYVMGNNNITLQLDRVYTTIKLRYLD